MEMVPILAVAIILFCVAQILKGTVLKNNEDLKAVLPYFCAILGAVLAVIIFLVNPSLIGAKNILDAIVRGAVSGLLATGGHQLYHQFLKLMEIRKAEETATDENKDAEE